MADARSKYKRQTPQVRQDSDRNQLTTLALAIDGLLAAAGDRWYVPTLPPCSTRNEAVLDPYHAQRLKLFPTT